MSAPYTEREKCVTTGFVAWKYEMSPAHVDRLASSGVIPFRDVSTPRPDGRPGRRMRRYMLSEVDKALRLRAEGEVGRMRKIVYMPRKRKAS